MKCLNCGTGEAVKDPQFGYLPCENCQSRQAKLSRPQKQIEFTSESIKTQRKQYAQDILQPYNKGELSKEYLDRYGKGRLKATDREIKRAKKVWTDDTYYK